MLALLSAGANRIPQPAVSLNGDIWYATSKYLMRWSLSAGVIETVSLGSEIICVCSFKGYLVVGNQDGRLTAVDPSTGSTEVISTLGSSITCLASDGGQGKLIVGVSSGIVMIFENLEAEPESTFSLPDGVLPLCLAVYGNYLAIGATSKYVYLGNLTSPESTLTSMSGHDDWVHALAFTSRSGQILLASASQDRYIRLWRVELLSNAAGTYNSELSTKPYVFGDSQAKFEALLIGHDDWVVSLAWESTGERLLSASSDSSLIIWAPSEDEDEIDPDDSMGSWLPQKRLGDVSIMGASTATGASGGFWTSLWLDRYIMTVSKTGSWRVWVADTLHAIPGLTGHYGTVTDTCWMGDCVLSTSTDQTTRLWSKSKAKAAKSPLTPIDHYFEVSRPQIHGYDMLAVASLNNNMFVSAGDEKVARVFQEPLSIAKLIGTDVTETAARFADFTVSVPALGLSNKENTDDVEQHQNLAELDLENVPTENALQRLTLWPELEKIYGHGYELTCLDISPDGKLLATCCKAKSEKHAVTRLYSTSDWSLLRTCGGHSLTVTRARFSPNSRFLLTVSRDRQWLLFDLSIPESVLRMPAAHSRIIWDCSWLNDSTFITVSRDKSVRKWSIDGTKLAQASFKEALTACDCSSSSKVIVGGESGIIYLLSTDLEILEDQKLSGDGRINRISCKRSVPECISIASDTLRIYDNIEFV